LTKTKYRFNGGFNIICSLFGRGLLFGGAVYTVGEKLPIIIIFGMQNQEKTLHKNIVNLLIAPEYCLRTTL